MNTIPTSSDSLPQRAFSVDGEPGSRLSALVDGELAPEELSAILLETDQSGELHAAWAAYQVIGESLRDPGLGVGLQGSQTFLAGVNAGLQQEAAHTDSDMSRPYTESTFRLDARSMPAANDAVFRWKLVAGLASLAAVMAVSWTLLGTSQASPGDGVGAQLALIGPASIRADAPVMMGALPTPDFADQAVVVNTSRGPLIRDPRLEALMAEHRHGGVSALQMPAGFLRNATYDDAGR